jgi:hypothetical protein
MEQKLSLILKICPIKKDNQALLTHVGIIGGFQNDKLKKGIMSDKKNIMCS